MIKNTKEDRQAALEELQEFILEMLIGLKSKS
jgi:hypothetical protein